MPDKFIFRTSMLLCLLLLFCMCKKKVTEPDPSDEPKTVQTATAQEQLNTVRDAANDLPADAVLVLVASSEVNEEGGSDNWIYVYYSPDKDQYYEYQIAGETIQRTDLSFEEEDLSTTPLPESWIDSEDAVTAVESQGGDTFRGRHSDCVISVKLIFWEGRVGKKSIANAGTAAWQVHYESFFVEIDAIVDADSGEILSYTSTDSDYPLVDARAKLDAAFSAAKQQSPDIYLVLIFTPFIEVSGANIGKSEGWMYLFYSPSQSKYYEVRVFGNNTAVEQQMNLESLEIGVAPLPPNWVNSDAALTTAQNGGGQNFMNTHSDVRVEAFLWIRPESGHPVWDVYYVTDTEEGQAVIDAYIATLIDWHIDTGGDEGGGFHGTAKEGLAEVVKKYPFVQSADLIWIGSGGVQASQALMGQNGYWSYIYKTGGKTYQVGIDGNRIDAPTEITSTHPEAYLIGAPALPAGWVDSDRALNAAENGGGQAFRTSNNVNIEMYLFPSGKSVSQRGSATWEVFYGISAENGRLFEIDAATGNLIN